MDDSHLSNFMRLVLFPDLLIMRAILLGPLHGHKAKLLQYCKVFEALVLELAVLCNLLSTLSLIPVLSCLQALAFLL